MNTCTDSTHSDLSRQPRIAVVLPCYNEALAIAQVVDDFRRALPNAWIYVFDNASSDGTSDIARAAGAIVVAEPKAGKGHVVRRAFAEVDADIYVIADGDGTYDASRAPEMIECLQRDWLDMVVGVRINAGANAYRRGHRLGNRMFNVMVGRLFGNRFTDILSGYRVLSRRAVKSFPALSKGFEIETELTVHALRLHMPTAEVPTDYRDRQEGTSSKLRTYRDGLHILRLIFSLARQNRPFLFYGIVAGLFACLSLLLAIPVFEDYLMTGLVPRLPTAILSTGIMLLAALSLTAGLILHSVYKYHAETKRLFYLLNSGRPAGFTDPDRHGDAR